MYFNMSRYLHLPTLYVKLTFIKYLYDYNYM